MIALIEQILSFDGLAWLIITVVFAGLVRGFAGFGTALVFMPIAASVTSPVWAIIIMMSFDIFGPIALLPKAWRDGEPTEVSLLVVGAILGLPIGVYFLTLVDPVLFRWLVSILSMAMLILLASGWRYQNPLNKIMLMAIGSLGGFMSGIAGISGPPVILTYMSSHKPASVIRGNTMLYLFFVDLVMFGVFLLKGLLVFIPLVIGLFLSVPYTLGGLVGQKIFNPNKEIIYRRIAYALIALSAIIGLPVWS
tara:strand:- start:3171 stop:3923 length:753 start_codon:yes stop_codon:yes gene_type:complete